MLQLDFAYTAKDRDIYQIDMQGGKEGLLMVFPSPHQFWTRLHEGENAWRDACNVGPFRDLSGTKGQRYYQEIAVNRAAGTRKTIIAFQKVLYGVRAA